MSNYYMKVDGASNYVALIIIAAMPILYKINQENDKDIGNKQEILESAIRNCDVTHAKDILLKGADINYQDHIYQSTVLMNAVHLSANKKCTVEKSIETIKFLLSSKANMFITDNSDNTAKDMAIHLSKYSCEEKDRVGHWSNKEDKEYHHRVTASSNCEGYKDIIKIFKDHEQKNNAYHQYEDSELKNPKVKNIEYKNSDFDKALRMGDLKVIKYFEEHFGNPKEHVRHISEFVHIMEPNSFAGLCSLEALKAQQKYYSLDENSDYAYNDQKAGQIMRVNICDRARELECDDILEHLDCE